MKAFWETVPLDEMNALQWELLCGRCGRCCLRKLEYEDTGEIVYTNVACRYLDIDRCRCTSYQDRASKNPCCLVMNPKALMQIMHLLPGTCAYRLVAQGVDLPWWHHLVCGDADMVHEASISVRGSALSEDHVHEDQIEEHIIDWVEP